MGITKTFATFLIFVTSCNAVRYSPTPATTSTLRPLLSLNTTNKTTTTPLPPLCPDITHTPLSRLRNAIKRQTVYDAFIVFHTDEHLSEEPSAEERRLEYISGWDGVGTAVVLPDDRAAIWVPGGEVRRAQSTLSSCEWLVLDADEMNQPLISAWIQDRIHRPASRRDQPRVGANPRLTSYEEWQAIASELQQGGIQLVPVKTLIDDLWKEETDPKLQKPTYSKIVAKIHENTYHNYSGPSWRDKVALVRSEFRNLGAEAMIVTALDEVAWLLNIRGRDMPTAPLLKAFVIIGSKDVSVYIPPGKLSMPVREALNMLRCTASNCTRVIDYTRVYDELHRLPESRILIPSRGTFQRGASYQIAQSIPESKRLFQPSPIIYLKAQKNQAEIRFMLKAHLKDAVAMCTLLNYLESRIKHGLDEKSVSRMVDETRATQAGYIGVSMPTRVAFGPNAAEPNYRPTNSSSRKIFSNSTLIIGSGGQYDEGTTVLTRTVHYGKPSREEKRAYTTVLRSLFALSSLSAPGTLPAAHADVAARAPLWAARQDYPHPTGHGVGAALNRVEDPVVIDYRQDANLHTFREGYFITSEPGWYETRRFGVKLGNVLEVIAKPNGFVGFKEATLVPYEPKLIDYGLLTEYEINWLNAYNDRIRRTVGPELRDQGLLDVYYWMTNKTQHIDPPSKLKKTTNAAHAHVYSKILIVAVLLVYV